MTFWRSLGFQTEMNDVLDKPSFTLEELLDKGDFFISECKNQNQKLMAFLLQEEPLQKLVGYVIGVYEEEEVEDEEETNQSRLNYARTCCEVLCQDDWALSNAVCDNESLLELFWSFLEREDGLVGGLVSPFACRAASILLQRKIQENFAVLKSKQNALAILMSKMGHSHVNELFQKVLQCDKGDDFGVVQWLREEDFVGQSIQKFSPQEPSSVHENTAMTLIDFFSPPPDKKMSSSVLMMITLFEQEDNLGKMMDFIVSGASPTGTYWGLHFVLELLKRGVELGGIHEHSPVEELPVVVRVCGGYLGRIADILREVLVEGEEYRINSSFGRVVPLRSYRLKALEFLAVLLSSRNSWVDEQFISTGIFEICVQLFFTYHWNNFLHSCVSDIIMPFLEEREIGVVFEVLFARCKLGERIIQADRENTEEVETQMVSSRGYMGFLNKFSNQIVAMEGKNADFHAWLENHVPGWIDYVNGSLKKHNELYSVILGGQKPDDHGMDDAGGPEDEEDLEAICTQYSVVQGFSEPTFGYGGGWEEEEEEEWGGDLGVVDEVVDAFDRLMAKEPYSAYESDEEE